MAETHPLGLLQLLVELVEGLAVFLPHLCQLQLVDLGLLIQGLFKVSHLRLPLGPEEGI